MLILMPMLMFPMLQLVERRVKERKDQVDGAAKYLSRAQHRRTSFTLWLEIRIQSPSSDIIHIDCPEEAEARKSDCWLHLDVLNGLVDEPSSVETLLRQKSPVSYVLACQTDGALEDVTTTYAMRFSVTQERRISSDNEWWSQLLKSTGSVGLSDTKQPMEAIPKTLSEFKNHSVYILSSQVGSTSCIIPARKKNYVAIFNGQFVYKRSDLSSLKSASSWMAAGRRVIDGECAFSERKKRVQSGEEVTVKLFGEWQTEKISRPNIIDGILPSNEHGSIEIRGGNEHLVPDGNRNKL